MSETAEQYYAEMEAARNAAEDAYFGARPSLSEVAPSQHELFRALFRAGFERAFQQLWRGGHDLVVCEANERLATIMTGAAGKHAERVVELEAEVSALREQLAKQSRLRAEDAKRLRELLDRLIEHSLALMEGRSDE